MRITRFGSVSGCCFGHCCFGYLVWRGHHNCRHGVFACFAQCYEGPHYNGLEIRFAEGVSVEDHHWVAKDEFKDYFDDDKATYLHQVRLAATALLCHCMCSHVGTSTIYLVPVALRCQVRSSSCFLMLHLRVCYTSRSYHCASHVRRYIACNCITFVCIMSPFPDPLNIMMHLIRIGRDTANLQVVGNSSRKCSLRGRSSRSSR